MKNVFKKYFIPHEANDYKPHFLREASVLVLAGIALFAFLFAYSQSMLITRTNIFASLYPSVLVDLTNSDRSINKLQPLAISLVLEDAARRKATDMVAGGYFAHTSPAGLTPWHWFGLAGYKFIYAGENLAVRFMDSGEVDKAWMSSPSHRANILSEHFTEIGIATAEGVYQGQATIFVVQMFGKPAVARASQNLIPFPTTKASPPLLADTRVKGETTQPPKSPDNLETIVSTDTFIAVKDNSVAEADTAPRVQSAAPYTTFFQRLLVSPRRNLLTFYFALGLLILTSLMLSIFIEIRRQHPRHIMYGVSLLLLLAVLAYAGNTFIFARVLVI